MRLQISRRFVSDRLSALKCHECLTFTWGTAAKQKNVRSQFSRCDIMAKSEETHTRTETVCLSVDVKYLHVGVDHCRLKLDVFLMSFQVLLSIWGIDTDWYWAWTGSRCYPLAVAASNSFPLRGTLVPTRRNLIILCISHLVIPLKRNLQEQLLLICSKITAFKLAQAAF